MPNSTATTNNSNPQQRHAYRDSLSGRPASSVYSQPSPQTADFPPPKRHHTQPQPQSQYNGRGGSDRYYYGDGPGPDEEVSPPSSPEQDRAGLVYVNHDDKYGDLVYVGVCVQSVCVCVCVCVLVCWC